LKETEKSVFKVFSGVKEAIDFADSPLLTPNSCLLPPNNEVFLIGGASIYNEGIQYTDKLYLTLVEGNFKADTFFPEYGNNFKSINESPLKHEGAFAFRFLTLERK
jgi:dihydrofolate reductase